MLNDSNVLRITFALFRAEFARFSRYHVHPLLVPIRAVKRAREHPQLNRKAATASVVIAHLGQHSLVRASCVRVVHFGSQVKVLHLGKQARVPNGDSCRPQSPGGSVLCFQFVHIVPVGRFVERRQWWDEHERVPRQSPADILSYARAPRRRGMEGPGRAHARPWVDRSLVQLCNRAVRHTQHQKIGDGEVGQQRWRRCE